MVLPRSNFLRSGLRSAGLRPKTVRARPQNVTRSLRRGYASEGEHQKKSSDLPWAIGAIVVTIPAAGWLYSQGPNAKPHLGPGTPGHEHSDENESKDDESESGDEKPSDKGEGGDEGDKDSKEEKDDKDDKDDKGDDKDESAGEESNEDGDGGDDKSDQDTGKKAAQVSTSQRSDKKDQSVARNETDSDEVKQKDSKVSSAGGQQSDQKANKSKLNFKRESNDPVSGAQHPYLDDGAKSTKGEGVKETAKIHGTVDSSRPLR